MDFDLGSSDADAWRAVNAELSAVPGPARRPPWWRRHLRWIVLALVADVVVGTLLFRWLRDEKATPERAVQQAVARVHDRDWKGLRDSLCAPDRARYGEAEIAQAGQAALLVLRGVDRFEVARVVTLPDITLLGPVALPARRVEGTVIASLGPPSEAHVTVVHEVTTWRVCLSAGGYGVTALGVDVPAEGDLLER